MPSQFLLSSIVLDGVCVSVSLQWRFFHLLRTVWSKAEDKGRLFASIESSLSLLPNIWRRNLADYKSHFPRTFMAGLAKFLVTEEIV